MEDLLVEGVDIEAELEADVVILVIRIVPEDVCLLLLVLFGRIFDIVEEVHELFELRDEFSFGVFDHVSYFKEKRIKLYRSNNFNFTFI